MMDRIVVDTNVFVSAIMLPLSVPRNAVDKVLDKGVLLFSEATIDELAEVLLRSKFGPYISVEERTRFLGHLRSTAEFIPIIQLVRECRDPNDDPFLDVALNGKADLILTGDADLLRMNPWRGIEIVSPVKYVRQ
jgi:uncharacterized protein